MLQLLKSIKKIYPKEVLIQAAYIKIEKYYILIDKDENYFIVTLKKKDESELKEDSVYEFFDEIIESQSYLDQLERTSKLREIILEKALLSQTVDDEIIKELEEE